MDNQHKLIKGYRDLSQAEIDLMNEVKAKAEEVGELVQRVVANMEAIYENLPDQENEESLRVIKAGPYRWVESGKEDLQVGFMKLVRSIAQPTTF